MLILPAGALGLHDFVPDGIANQLGKRFEPEFPHDFGAVPLSGTSRYAEAISDLFVALALGQELDDLPFAGCENGLTVRIGFGRGFLRQVRLSYGLSDPGGKEPSPFCDALHSRDHI